MNKDKIKGMWNVAKGKIKEEVGHATGDTDTEAEGIADQVKGRIQRGVGKVRDTLKKAIDSVLRT